MRRRVGTGPGAGSALNYQVLHYKNYAATNVVKHDQRATDHENQEDESDNCSKKGVVSSANKHHLPLQRKPGSDVSSDHSVGYAHCLFFTFM